MGVSFKNLPPSLLAFLLPFSNDFTQVVDFILKRPKKSFDLVCDALFTMQEKL